jgi:hypothetical protein
MIKKIRNAFDSHAKNYFVNLWQLFIDLNKQSAGPMAFDIREPGYLRSLYGALNYMLATIEQPINTHYIATLHDLSIQYTHSLESTLDENDQLVERPHPFRHGYRIDHSAGYSYNAKENCTLKGLVEIYQVIASKRIEGIQFEQQVEGQAPIEVEDLEPHRIQHFFIIAIQQIDSRTKSMSLTSFSNNIINRVNNEITIFYNTMKAIPANDKHSILRNIITLIRNLELIHPFYDGNCRTLAMLLLNKLLLQYHFSPCILVNPNIIDGYSIDELLIEIRRGMKRFIAAKYEITSQKEQNLNGSDPNFLIYFTNNYTLCKLYVINTLEALPFWPRIHKQEMSVLIQIFTLQLAQNIKNGYNLENLIVLSKNISELVKQNITADDNNFYHVNFNAIQKSQVITAMQWSDLSRHEPYRTYTMPNRSKFSYV